jgi:hypothetical protein
MLTVGRNEFPTSKKLHLSRIALDVGFPESKFQWAIEKKKYFQTIYIAI